MMCVKTFKVKNRDYFKDWSQWLEFVNSNERYCETESKVFDWKEKCNSWDLPSTHPYWGHVVMENSKKTLVRHKARYEECKKDYDKIKYYYNQDTSLQDIEGIISKLEKEILNFENTLKY